MKLVTIAGSAECELCNKCGSGLTARDMTGGPSLGIGGGYPGGDE